MVKGKKKGADFMLREEFEFEGLILRPVAGDVVNIDMAERQVVHQTSENGLIAVKTYRYDTSAEPQWINSNKNKKRLSDCDLPDKQTKKIKTQSHVPQPTAEQARRQVEIAAEKKWVGDENNAVKAEYIAIAQLKQEDPNNPDIARRKALNKERASEAHRRGNVTSERRRELILEINRPLEGASFTTDDKERQGNAIFKQVPRPSFDCKIPMLEGTPTDTPQSINQTILGEPDPNTPQITSTTTDSQYAGTPTATLSRDHIHHERLSLMNSGPPQADEILAIEQKKGKKKESWERDQVEYEEAQKKHKARLKVKARRDENLEPAEWTGLFLDNLMSDLMSPSQKQMSGERPASQLEQSMAGDHTVLGEEQKENLVISTMTPMVERMPTEIKKQN